ncbi:hypothetical membrane protein, putative permease (EamA domain), type 3 [Campylobacter iguaniorum]|uniref:Hypothetical membrane protein, putative permease (EamA domain), type 3 n=1 Tax=Campylobacter iguaniorum TaxID=1244531 RepID=A0A076FCW1_9BACT|nr:EamA family transporter [Campylobacter iguaniorum]AII15468.1 hypothetical membrane protein, putative permease (EamA domain), type 3 [Campylobacter iguaniorum]
MKNSNYIFGVAITLLGGILWGFSGACGQYLFTQKGVSADWLVPYRLLLSGIILLLVYIFKNPKILFLPLKNPRNLPTILLYSLIGLMLTQYSYFYSIELSNAAVATVIQYTAPVFILIVACLLEKRLPYIKELIALFLAIVGVFFLATHGEFGTLVISKTALLFCLISALSIVVYNFAPKRLNKEFPISLVLGWGLVIGGVVLSLYMRVWSLEGVSDFGGYLALGGIIVFGTILAFSFYMTGVGVIGPTRASLIAAIEPASAGFFSYFWLGTEFAFFDYFGFGLIMLCVFLLSKKD